MNSAGVNNSTLRLQNRRLILRLIATGQCLSRIDIARETGLSKMAATNIINEFISEGIVEEKEKQQVSGKGRNPILLGITPTAPKLLGVHIKRDFCEASVCDLRLSILGKKSTPLTKGDPDRMIEEITGVISSLLLDFKKEKILGIGVGAEGPVNTTLGRILDPDDPEGISTVDIKDVIAVKTGLPVFFLNEFDCAALAELYFGKGKDLKDFIFIGLSRRIGASIVSNGGLYRSGTGLDCEFGHISIDYKGPLCKCGRRGCVGAYISGEGFKKELRKVAGEDLSFEEFCKKYEKSAPEETDRFIKDAVSKLSYGIANLVNTTCKQNYIIGCEGCFVPDRYIDEMKDLVSEMIVFKRSVRINIVKSELHKKISSGSCAAAVFDILLSRYTGKKEP